MKNILNIDVNTICNCTCFENIDNGVDEIIIRYKRDNPINPRIKIEPRISGKEPVEYPLEFNEGIALFAFPLDIFIDDIVVGFRFLDDDYEGTLFQIFCNNVGLLGKWCRTLKLFRASEYYYIADVIYNADLSTITIGDGLEIDDEGNLNVINEKNAIAIDLAIENDLVTKITFKYDDESTSEYSAEYDSEQRLIKFGGIEVNWT